jgi:short-subunit dehydrogenase
LGLAALTAPIFFFPRRTFGQRSVVITGGSRGLGLALARRLLKQEANVTLLARDAEELLRAKELLHTQVPGSEHRLFTVNADVTDGEHLDHAFAEARARFGGIDVLINNAGSITVAPFDAQSVEDFDALMNLHFRAVVQSTKLIQPYLRMSGGGHIVNVSSLGGVMPLPHLSSYSASKFALGGFSESVAAELRSHGIYVTTVYPGLMRTGSPIQATFKGDQEAEYAWFASGATTPGLSMSADCAAARILKAAADGQTRLVLSMPAKLGALFHSLAPELFGEFAALTARLLPSGTSPEMAKGSDVRRELAAQGADLPTDGLSRIVEAENNQVAMS